MPSPNIIRSSPIPNSPSPARGVGPCTPLENPSAPSQPLTATGSRHLEAGPPISTVFCLLLMLMGCLLSPSTLAGAGAGAPPVSSRSTSSISPPPPPTSPGHQVMGCSPLAPAVSGRACSGWGVRPLGSGCGAAAAVHDASGWAPGPCPGPPLAMYCVPGDLPSSAGCGCREGSEPNTPLARLLPAAWVSMN